MAIEYIGNHTEQALARLTQQFKSSTKVQALLSALVGPSQGIEDAQWELLTERGVETAVGIHLDKIGAIVGQRREGLTDAIYRRYIRARIIANRSDGLVEDLIAVVRAVIADANAVIVLEQLYPAAVYVRVFEFSMSAEIAAALIKFLLDAVAAGVRILLEFVTGGNDSETFFFAQVSFLNGAHSSGATTLTVNSTAGFADTGSLDIDLGTAVSETRAYTGRTATTFTGVTATANAHAANAAVQQVGSPGKGFGDDSDTSIGGLFASVVEA